MCVMHLRSKQYYKVVCIGKMNECRRLVRHYAHERTIVMGIADRKMTQVVCIVEDIVQTQVEDRNK